MKKVMSAALLSSLFVLSLAGCETKKQQPATGLSPAATQTPASGAACKVDPAASEQAKPAEAKPDKPKSEHPEHPK